VKVGRIPLPRRRRDRVLLYGGVIVGCSVLAASMASGQKVPDMAGRTLRTFRTTAFDVDLPCRPEAAPYQQKTAAGILSVDLYRCFGGTDGYSIGTTTPPAPPDHGFNLTADADKSADNLGGTVKDLTATTYLGRPAVDFRVPDARQNFTPFSGFVRLIDAGGVLYELHYLKQGGDIRQPPADWNLILNSLHIH
jgi:hypothetical protein